MTRQQLENARVQASDLKKIKRTAVNALEELTTVAEQFEEVIKQAERKLEKLREKFVGKRVRYRSESTGLSVWYEVDSAYDSGLMLTLDGEHFQYTDVDDIAYIEEERNKPKTVELDGVFYEVEVLPAHKIWLYRVTAPATLLKILSALKQQLGFEVVELHTIMRDGLLTVVFNAKQGE